jgi:LuxR family maltose regulon positive regulatory protein
MHRKLTLISAPAGFGKTTLVSEWVANLRLKAADDVSPSNAVAWLSLDGGDNDIIRFLTYVISALQTIETRQELAVNIGKWTLSTLRSPQPPPTEGILTATINEIAALPDRIILVLDDYHLIDVQPIHDALAFLLRHMPPNMHLVIITRVDPPLPLARLRARGHLMELRAADLRFAPSETSDFFNRVMGLALSVEDVAALDRRTEGWIAGLQLAALALQGPLAKQGVLSMRERKDVTGFIQSFTGSHHYVLDYLVEEVLEQQSENVQAFLLQTAILDRLTGSLCDTVCSIVPASGQHNGQMTLERLAQSNLFIIALDDERRWYRYHHLFADLLRQRLRQKQPDLIPTLHIRVSAWYEQNGFVDEAIEHALRAEDFERAIVLIEGVAEAVWMQARHTKLRRWLDRVPLESVFSRPQLCIFHAWSLFATGKPDAAEQSLQAAEKALAPNTGGTPETLPIERVPQSSTDRMTLQGRIAATRAFLAFFRGDVPGIIQFSRQAIEYLPKQDLLWRRTAIITLGDAHIVKGEITEAYQVQLEALEASKAIGNIYMILMTHLKLATTMREQGRLEQVIEICQQQIQFANEHGLSQTAAVGWALAIWSEVLAEIDDLDSAIHQAKKGVELTRHGGDVAILGWSYLCLTRILFTSGDMTGAEAAIQEMAHIARETDVPPWIMNIIATWQVRIWLAQDNLNIATQWMQERGLSVGKTPTLLYDMEYGIVSARILMAQGRLDEALSLLQRLLETAETGGRTSKVIEILILQALSFQAKDAAARALSTLEDALVLAEPDGFIRTFVDEGPSMARLLYEALSRGIAPDYIRRLLSAFPAAEPASPPSSAVHRPSSDLFEPLSDREMEVLHLIAEGLTNREIATQLFLSPHTIKTHTRNIYGKLDVHSRTQAVARAQALGLLPAG